MVEKIFADDPNPIATVAKEFALTENQIGVPNNELGSLIGLPVEGDTSDQLIVVGNSLVQALPGTVDPTWDALWLEWNHDAAGTSYSEIGMSDWLALAPSTVGSAALTGGIMLFGQLPSSVHLPSAHFFIGRSATNQVLVWDAVSAQTRLAANDRITWTPRRYSTGIIGSKLSALTPRHTVPFALHVRAYESNEPAVPVGVTYDGVAPIVPTQTPDVEWRSIETSVGGLDHLNAVRWIAVGEAVYDDAGHTYSTGNIVVLNSSDSLNVQFSVDGVGGWHTLDGSGDYWIRYRESATDAWTVRAYRPIGRGAFDVIVSDLAYTPATADSALLHDLPAGFDLNDYAFFVFQWRRDTNDEWSEVITSSRIFRWYTGSVTTSAQLGYYRNIVLFRGNPSWQSSRDGNRPAAGAFVQAFNIGFVYSSTLNERWLHFVDPLTSGANGAGILRVLGVLL